MTEDQSDSKIEARDEERFPSGTEAAGMGLAREDSTPVEPVPRFAPESVEAGREGVRDTGREPVRPPALRLVVAALMLRGGQVLICQRRPDQPMALQWEFPGGKIEPGEGPEQALARELDEELGIRATIGPRVTHIRHNYRHGGAVDLQFFAVYEYRGEIENRIFNDVRWVRIEELTQYDFLVADRGLIRDLAQGKLL